MKPGRISTNDETNCEDVEKGKGVEPFFEPRAVMEEERL